MKILATPLKEVWCIEFEPFQDERGFFARSYCKKEFAEHGIKFDAVQCNVSFNIQAGTIRGLHYLREPAGEAKIVRCVRGAIYDVVVDLRLESPTYMKHFSVTLKSGDLNALYIPPRFAHGFQTLDDQTEVFYMMGDYYSPGYEAGLRYDDPKLGIEWPHPVSTISDKDKEWPLL